jgi:hypothetical protein
MPPQPDCGRPVKPYLCYVHRQDRPLSDLAVVTCDSEDDVRAAVEAVLDTWPSFTRVDVYDSERRIMTLPGRSQAPAASTAMQREGGARPLEEEKTWI